MRFSCGNINDKGMVFHSYAGKTERWYDPAMFMWKRSKSATRQRQRYHENLEESRKKLREWHHANKDKKKASHDRWRAANRAKDRETSRVWNENNKDKIAGYYSTDKAKARNAKAQARRRALKAGSEVVSGYEEGLLYQLARTFTTATGIRHEVDHIMPISRGGDHEIDNLMIIPESTNRIKHDTVIDWPPILGVFGQKKALSQ